MLKKVVCVLLLLTITACTVGEMKSDRKKLYEMGNDICDTKPERCINGIPW